MFTTYKEYLDTGKYESCFVDFIETFFEWNAPKSMIKDMADELEKLKGRDRNDAYGVFFKYRDKFFDSQELKYKDFISKNKQYNKSEKIQIHCSFNCNLSERNFKLLLENFQDIKFASILRKKMFSCEIKNIEFTEEMLDKMKKKYSIKKLTKA